MTIDEAIKTYTSNAEYERTHGNLQGCLDFRQLAEWLKELKQLREQTRWIPCKESLPEGDDFVLATCKMPYGNLCTYLEILRRTNDGSWTDNLDYYSPDSVIAWMPFLPEPYEPQESEE